MTMKILFCSRDFSHYKNNELMQFYQKEQIKNIDNSFLNTGSGFFYNTLKAIGHLNICFGIDQTLKYLESSKYDLIVFDFKLFINSKIKISYLNFFNEINTPKILFYAYDKNISSKTLTKLCSLLNLKAIFVPNLYKDTNNYDLSEEILNKIYPTYLGMGNQDLIYNHVDKKIINHDLKNEDFFKKYDFFFAGSSNSNKYLRNEFYREVQQDQRFKEYKYFIKFFQPTAKVNNLDKFEFLKKIKESIVSIDLSGDYDNLTMRFNEIIFNYEIPLVDRGFKKYALSDHYENIVDDFCFENIDQFFFLVKKYQDKRIREKTIAKLNQIWKSYYCPSKHGEEIIKILKI